MTINELLWSQCGWLNKAFKSIQLIEPQTGITYSNCNCFKIIKCITPTYPQSINWIPPKGILFFLTCLARSSIFSNNSPSIMEISSTTKVLWGKMKQVELTQTMREILNTCKQHRKKKSSVGGRQMVGSNILPTTNQPSTDHLLTIYRPSTDHLPTTYQPLSNHLPTSNRPSTGHHLLTIYRPSTDHLPTTYQPPTDHLWTTYGPPSDHLLTTYQPPNDHLLTTYWPPTNHLLTTYRPSIDHLPTTYRSPTDHLPTTYQPPTNRLLTTYRPSIDHLTTTY